MIYKDKGSCESSPPCISDVWEILRSLINTFFIGIAHMGHSLYNTHCNTLQHTATHCNTLFIGSSHVRHSLCNGLHEKPDQDSVFVKLPFLSGFPFKWHSQKYFCSLIHGSFTQNRPNLRSNLSREFLQLWRRRVLTCMSDDGWLTFLDGYCSTWWVLWLCSWTARVPFLASCVGSATCRSDDGWHTKKSWHQKSFLLFRFTMG